MCGNDDEEASCGALQKHYVVGPWNEVDTLSQ
jgi:hypothetical protein